MVSGVSDVRVGRHAVVVPKRGLASRNIGNAKGTSRALKCISPASNNHVRGMGQVGLVLLANYMLFLSGICTQEGGGKN